MNTIDFSNYKFQAAKIFAEIAPFETTADPSGIPGATLKRFKECATRLAELLKSVGVKQVKVSKEAYVYATIESNMDTPGHTIVLMSHYDTATDHQSEGAEVIVHHNYAGGDLQLKHNDITIWAHELANNIGQDIITGTGAAQIGADDKVGIAEIIDAVAFLIQHPEIPHPQIKIVFNHNEEVGRGIEFLDFAGLNADYAYCVDAGEVGNLFTENFNAEEVNIKVTGVTVHPGWAKGKMINALNVVRELYDELSSKFLAPEQSEKREPYMAFREINGTWSEAKAKVMLRAFDKEQIAKMKTTIDDKCLELLQTHEGVKIKQEWEQHHRYENAGEILAQFPLVNTVAEEAYKAVGVKAVADLVRGGFDGVNMSFRGLPTTNLFNGAHNMHGLNEWSSVQEMELSVQMLVNLCHLWSKYPK